MRRGLPRENCWVLPNCNRQAFRARVRSLELIRESDFWGTAMKQRFLNGASAAVLATVFSFGAASSPAQAAPPAPVPVVSIYNWTGFYVGGNVGAAWGSSTPVYTDPSLGGSGIPTSFSGYSWNDQQLQSGIFGVQAGYNWQINNSWVSGLEADFQFNRQRAHKAFNFPYNDGESFGNLSGTLSTRISWFGTVRGRLGYLINPQLLVYGTAGLAYGKVGVSGSFFDTGDCSTCSWGFNASTTKIGWSAGAGLEGAFPGPGGTKNWTWKAEYLHIDLGNFSGTGVNPDLSGTYYWNAKFTNEILRFGVNYHFH